MVAMKERLKSAANAIALSALHLTGCGVAVLLSAAVIFIEMWAYSAIIGETVETLALGLITLMIILLVTFPMFVVLSSIARVATHLGTWMERRGLLLAAAMIANGCLMLLPSDVPTLLQPFLLVLPSAMMAYVFGTIAGLRPEPT
jgi:hypothetical protein